MSIIFLCLLVFFKGFLTAVCDCVGFWYFFWIVVGVVDGSLGLSGGCKMRCTFSRFFCVAVHSYGCFVALCWWVIVDHCVSFS